MCKLNGMPIQNEHILTEVKSKWYRRYVEYTLTLHIGLYDDKSSALYLISGNFTPVSEARVLTNPVNMSRHPAAYSRLSV